MYSWNWNLGVFDETDGIPLEASNVSRKEMLRLIEEQVLMNSFNIQIFSTNYILISKNIWLIDQLRRELRRMKNREIGFPTKLRNSVDPPQWSPVENSSNFVEPTP